MPYVFVEELGEGQEEADVVERDVTDAIADERDEARSQVESLTSERDSLAQQLNAAKTKFADAFLSTPQKAVEEQKQNVHKQDSVSSYSELFNGRKSNAN